MPRPSLPLLRGTTTLESALEEEDDMLLALDHLEQRIDFFVALYSSRADIAQIAAGHLGLRSSDPCQLGGVKEWLHGSFNVCIPVYVNNQARPQAIIRFPLPYKVGESRNPGNVDEKVRCEAATFISMREHCPEIPIPRLWGFGLVQGQSFTAPENVPWERRFLRSLQRCLSWLLGRPQSCRYVDHRRSTMVENGYLGMEYIGSPELQMLSETWDQDRHHQDKRKNLFRSLSRIMLALSKTPLPRIGSWTMDSDGVLQLSNRPLGLRLHQLEHDGIPTNISRSFNYATADAYYLDLLSCHDSRIRYQPNSLTDHDDGRAQMARLAIMRALLPQFTNRELREGPFFYRLTDLHPSNVFMDRDWNVTCVIDLEWAYENLTEFGQVHGEFVDIFEEEENSFPPINHDQSYRTHLMRRGWQIGNSCTFILFFASTHSVGSDFARIVSDYWAADVEAVIAAKLRDKEEYETKLAQRFEAVADPSADNLEERVLAGYIGPMARLGDLVYNHLIPSTLRIEGTVEALDGDQKDQFLSFARKML
ncbi:hypothetical protein ASPCADRAFT_510270 [Aspergillus carbonarius ITEM 5010]|uniref:Aminoglycoside phosphotransferase domain-containing protein n=1 Tax=Aspergillus carbonarius (strain ITEM 5010) TaxID=602072 RepID=A0A1R3RAG1_ASPC5|nr:hypothetical protein ASPCADRAFT_510270 [Aspergillus carbonarius ITEM 5010]